MAQPKLEYLHMFAVLKHRRETPFITVEDLATWGRKQFPHDDFIKSDRFAKWIDGGRGGNYERQFHSMIMSHLDAQSVLDRMNEAEERANQEATLREHAEAEVIKQQETIHSQQDTIRMLEARVSEPSAV